MATLCIFCTGAYGVISVSMLAKIRRMHFREKQSLRAIAKQTGKTYESVLADMERDFWMSAEEAVAYGIVSRIIERQTDLS